jgi:hypothetical protein
MVVSRGDDCVCEGGVKLGVMEDVQVDAGMQAGCKSAMHDPLTGRDLETRSDVMTHALKRGRRLNSLDSRKA